MKRLLSLLGLLVVALSSFAQTFTVGDLEYKVTSTTDKTVEVSNGSNATGDVVVPETVTYNDVEYSVTAIGNSAFSSNTSIISVSMPSVTSIDNYAFQDCSSLTSANLPAVLSIGYNAFFQCISLISVNLQVVTSLSGQAFGWCSNLRSLRIGSLEQWCSVDFVHSLSNPLYSTSKSVDLYIGDSDTPATNIEMPSTVTKIPDYAFRKTTLKSVYAPAATSIGSDAFDGCTSLTSANLPAATSIGDGAFKSCTSLSDACVPVAVSIGDGAFKSCTSLTSINLPAATSISPNAFQYCTYLSSVNLPVVMSIGYQAFDICSNISTLRIGSVEQWCNVNFDNGRANPLEDTRKSVELYIGDSETPATSIEVPNTVTKIPDYAFRNTTITSVSAPAATSIGESAFLNCPVLTSIFVGATPATVSNCFNRRTSIVVPDDAYDAYVEAWPSYVNQITIASQREREVTVEAMETESALHRAIGEKNLRHVQNLKVKGSINGYDIMLIRNKMINLHNLDLSEANIVGNDYEYYTGYHTADNEISPYAFYNLSNLFRVKLPEITAIRERAFANCTNLREISLPGSESTVSKNTFAGCFIPSSVESIEPYAFYNCSSLDKLTFQEGVSNIGNDAFNNCAITYLRLPESLTAIGDYAFRGNKFEVVNFPPNLNTVGSYAFQNCNNLEVVRLNPMLKNISNYVFNGCNALKKVYTYLIEPASIQQDTYSAYKSADLYVPQVSYYNYYYNTQWSQFLSVNETDEEYNYKSFFLDCDLIIDCETGIISGKPDAELNENSGFTNNSECETQALGTVTIRFNGNNGSASIIANGNMTAEKIKVEIDVTGNKWHFFCFPFDVPLSGVSVSGNKAYIFRHYNAAKRATGASGWEDLPADQTVLKAGEGYIFQANGNSKLIVTVDNKTTFVGENVATALQVQDAANVANASWNFKGNPGYAYFDIDDLGFSAPITVWDPNTNSYVALRPGDDDAFLHPFQAFFVQKPEGTDALTFNAEDRTTYLKSKKKMEHKAKARSKATVNSSRRLVNISVTDGVSTDKTRVVFNDKKSMAYEMECDAAKFVAADAPQLYSIGSDNTHYAINERPNGEGTVQLGFTADKAGRFRIMADRMDAHCCLQDLMLNTMHDLSLGAYEFDSQKGTFENRFVLVNTLVAGDVTGLETIQLDDVAADAVVYDIQGRRLQRAERGVMVVNGKKVIVK